MAALLVAHGRPGFYLRVLEEGEVEAGDEILRVASGPESMSVFEINALLYMPGHPRISWSAPAHPGTERPLAWFPRGAARAGAQRRRDDRKRRAHSGVRPAPSVAGVPPATGIAQGAREQQRHLAGARARGWAPSHCGSARPVHRGAAKAFPRCTSAYAQYSLSDEPSAARYRVSVKREAHGAAGAYIDEKLQVGDVVDASAGAGRIHASTRRRARRSAERGHRGDPRARNAPRVGTPKYSGTLKPPPRRGPSLRSCPSSARRGRKI